MTRTKAIIDIPTDKLQQIVKDLYYEVGKENIYVSLQLNNLWKVEYIFIYERKN